MSLELEEPILGWRTLKDIYGYYLARTPSEEGISAAEVLERAEKETRVREVAVQVQTVSDDMSPEQATQALVSIKEDKDQAEWMRAIVAHLMTRDAAAGLWFAIGRKDGVGRYQLIHPSYWNFLLMNIEEGAVGRDPSLRFEDLRCALTKDVPDDHPIRAMMQADLKEGWPAASSNAAVREIVSPPSAPTSTSDRGQYDGPGRPSTFHLVEQEFDKRTKKNALEASLNWQGEVLSDWFKSTHPHLRPYQPKTVVNRLRKKYRAAVIRSKNDPKL